MVNKRRIISRNVIKKCIGKIGQTSLVTLGDFDEIVKRDARISWVSGNVNDLKLKSKFHAEHTNLNAIMSDFLKRSLIQLYSPRARKYHQAHVQHCSKESIH